MSDVCVSEVSFASSAPCHSQADRPASSQLRIFPIWEWDDSILLPDQDGLGVAHHQREQHSGRVGGWGQPNGTATNFRTEQSGRTPTSPMSPSFPSHSPRLDSSLIRPFDCRSPDTVGGSIVAESTDDELARINSGSRRPFGRCDSSAEIAHLLGEALWRPCPLAASPVFSPMSPVGPNARAHSPVLQVPFLHARSASPVSVWPSPRRAAPSDCSERPASSIATSAPAPADRQAAAIVAALQQTHPQLAQWHPNVPSTSSGACPGAGGGGGGGNNNNINNNSNNNNSNTNSNNNPNNNDTHMGSEAKHSGSHSISFQSAFASIIYSAYGGLDEGSESASVVVDSDHQSRPVLAREASSVGLTTVVSEHSVELSRLSGSGTLEGLLPSPTPAQHPDVSIVTPLAWRATPASAVTGLSAMEREEEEEDEPSIVGEPTSVVALNDSDGFSSQPEFDISSLQLDLGQLLALGRSGPFHLSSDEAKRLPKVKFEAPERQVCSICLEAFGQGMFVTGLPCAHVFHVDCLSQWVQRAAHCPNCRATVAPGIIGEDVDGGGGGGGVGGGDVVVDGGGGGAVGGGGGVGGGVGGGAFAGGGLLVGDFFDDYDEDGAFDVEVEEASVISLTPPPQGRL